MTHCHCLAENESRSVVGGMGESPEGNRRTVIKQKCGVCILITVEGKLTSYDSLLKNTDSV